MAISSSNSGFTLVEVLVASTIMIVGLLGLLQAVNIAIEHNLKNILRDEAVIVAEERLQVMKNRPFADLTSVSSYENITTQIRAGKKSYRVQYQVSSATTAPIATTDSKKLKVTVYWSQKGQASNLRITTFKARD